jgi:hypothetical protein
VRKEQVVGDTGEADKVVEGPDESGQLETPPQTEVDPLAIAQEVDAQMSASEGGEGEPLGEEPQVLDVEGADDTTMSDPVLDALSKVPGFEKHDFKTGEDALKSFGELRGQIGQRDELAVLGQQVLPHLSDFQQWQVEQAERARAQREESAWSPPAAPETIERELAKPEDQRDPKIIEQYNAHTRYKEEKWARWTDDPRTFVAEMVTPQVQQMVRQAIDDDRYESSLRAKLDADREVVTAHEAEITGLMRAGVPAEAALELTKRRHGLMDDSGEAAKQADLEKLERKTPAGPSGVVRRLPRVVEEPDPSDPASYARLEAKKQGFALD